MMKRRHFNLIKTGRKSKLALAVGLALAMSAMGSVYASGNDDTFKNFANKDALMKAAEGFKTQEFKNSTGLEAIGADKAYALGYSGKGITVGMVDTPVYSKHSELSGDKKIQKYGYGSDDLFSIFNDRDHGTHIAGIIAANKDEKGMHGIAYDANLISLGADKLPNGGYDDAGAYKLYIDKIKNIQIINNSWSFINDHIDLSIKDIREEAKKELRESNYYKILSSTTKQCDQINVYASGNEGSIFSPAYTSGVGMFDEMKNNIVNVMAMNSHTGQLSSFSCLAKNAEDWTVVAPGTGINSLDAKNPFSSEYTKGDGTSAAAPYVSGTLALIKEAFPYLSGKQIVETLLSTCNDKFLEDNYTVQLNTDENNNLVAINLVYIDELEKQSDENNKKALEKYYNATIKNETFFKTICDKYGIKNAEDFIRLFSKNEIGKIYYLTGKEAYGYGMVDVGKAVQGIGKIITSRLKSQDKSNIFTKESDVYLYSIDTGKKDANYKNRDYTIWSNDIGEELSADGLHAGITKKGEVDLVLLGDNTYLGPTISKDGKIQIVRGVSGNTFAIDNGIIEINGKANEVYSLNGGSTVVKDNITQKEQKPLELYGRSNADFYNSALPNTNKVDINGGLFAIGKNSITGEGSTINVNLTRSDSVIKGALYQDELGKINLSLANEAKFILQQGTGYYAGNSFKSNDTVNNLRMDSFATFDMSQDGVYSTLKIDKLQGRDGQFILGTDLANCKGDSIFVTGSDAGEHWISIVDKNGVYADNEDGAKKVLVATTPDNVKFKGLALAQDMGINQYNFTPNIYYDENIKGWYFDGFDKVDDTGAFNGVVTDSKVLTTNAILNKGISNRGNGIFNFKVLQAEKPAMLIKRKESNNGIFGGIWGSVKFLGDGPIKVDVENTNSYAGMQNKYSRTIAIGYHSDLNYIFEANQNVDIKVTSGSKRVHGIYCAPERDIDYKSADGIYGQSLNGKLNSSVLFNSDLSINVSGNGVNQKYVGIENTGAFTVKGKSNITIEEAYDGNEVSIYNYGGNMRFYGDSIISGGRLVNESKKYYDTINKNVYSYENPKIYFDKNLEFYNNGIENHGELIINGDALLYNATLYNNGKCNVNGNLYVKKDLENPSYLHISNGPNGSMHINGSLISDGSYIDNYGDLRLCGDSVIYNYNCRDGAVLTVDNFKVNNFTCYYGNTTTTINSLLDIGELNAQKIIFKILINQEKPNDGDLKSAKLVVGENKTENAKHIISLLPMQEDFLLTNNTKINPFTIIEDSSEKNGGYKLNFTINPFDAGAYNYTPTLTNEKSKDNVDLWKVTDIKLTGSTPDPTPDPDPNPTPTPDPNPDPNPDPAPNPNPTPDPDPNPNPTPDPDPTPAPVLSNLTYNTRANAINNYYRWRDEYNNLQKRLGDLRMSTEENGLWARTFHGKEESGKYGLNNQYNAFQIGYDKQLLQDDGGKWFVGAAVTSYDGKTNYAKQGKADNNSIGLALYGSYLGEKGHYFDVVARHSRLKSELTSYAAGTGNKITGDYHNWGSSLSMEYGRRISMKHDFYLQPEAELTYGTTSSASYSLSDGSRVKQDGISSLTVRAGLTVGKEFKNSNIFASISAVHDFGDDNVFSITDKYGKTYKDISNLKDSWYELSVGGNVKFNNNTYIYADLEKTFGGDIQTKWRYNFGVRYSF